MEQEGRMTIRVLESLEGDQYASIDDMIIWLCGTRERVSREDARVLASVELVLLRLKGDKYVAVFKMLKAAYDTLEEWSRGREDD